MKSGLKKCNLFSIENLARSSVTRDQQSSSSDAVVTSSYYRTLTEHRSLNFPTLPKTKLLDTAELAANISVDSGCSVASSLEDENIDTSSDEDRSRCSGSKNRKKREAFQKYKVIELETMYEKRKYLTPAERNDLATKLQLSNQQVKTWFQNRRMKDKRAKRDNPFPTGGVDASQLAAMGVSFPGNGPNNFSIASVYANQPCSRSAENVFSAEFQRLPINSAVMQRQYVAAGKTPFSS